VVSVAGPGGREKDDSGQNFLKKLIWASKGLPFQQEKTVTNQGETGFHGKLFFKKTEHLPKSAKQERTLLWLQKKQRPKKGEKPEKWQVKHFCGRGKTPCGRKGEDSFKWSRRGLNSNDILYVIGRASGNEKRRNQHHGVQFERNEARAGN